MDKEFTIEQEPAPPLDDLPVLKEAVPFLGEATQSESDAKILTLEKALELAVKHNRSYQNQKESLYLEALALTLERHQYTPIFSGKGTAGYRGTPVDITHYSTLAEAMQAAPGVVDEIGRLAGTPADLISRYSSLVEQAGTVTGLSASHVDVIEDRDVSGNTQLGVDTLLKGGGRIAVDLTSNFLRFLTGDSRVSTSSALVGDFTQPLLRGAGKKVAAERLTQAERDVLYALRAFTRFRQEFTVKICGEYYNVLQERDTVRNNWNSLERFKTNVDRERAFAAEGQRTQAELGRLEQAQLNNEDNWTGSVRRYKQALDQFKIELGLPVSAPIVLDDAELDALKKQGVLHPTINSDDAVKVAMTARLDLYTEYDKTEDAGRKVYVAANALKPGLDLLAGVKIPSDAGDNFQNLDFERYRWNVGVDTDLGLDRKQERNSYRAALINAERAKRELDLAKDEISLEVRDAWRTLDQARRAYEIAVKGVQLNQRRVEEQNLLAELGRATALNQVDAQNDLNTAENDLTAALVSHTVARLQFWRDMGILFIKSNGQWEEVKDVQS
jgi:outer membrane protein TolC